MRKRNACKSGRVNLNLNLNSRQSALSIAKRPGWHFEHNQIETVSMRRYLNYASVFIHSKRLAATEFHGTPEMKSERLLIATN